MEDKHIGSVVSTETHDGSVYQGKLTTWSSNNGSITMANVIKDGLPLHRCVTLSTLEISSLRVIRAPGAVTIKKKEPSAESECSLSSSLFSTSISPQKTKKSPVKKFSANVEKLFEHHASPSKQTAKGSSTRSRNQRSSPEKNGAVKNVTEEISATPLFKNYEPQVPQPKVLSQLFPNGSSKSGSCSKKQGPSGNPVLDALNHYKGIGSRNNKTDLAEPINFDLNADFDFAENLKLFEKDQEDDEYYETVEKLKVSQNFAHYENIVDDENRVTSWTNLKARGAQTIQEKKANFQVTAVSFEKSMNGQPIPAISATEKKEFLKECKLSLGEAVLDTVMADRLFQWLCEMQLAFGDSQGTVVLLASAANSVRSIRRLLTHIDKRRYNCHLFGKYPGEHFEHVNVVDEVKLLPQDVSLICVLSQEVNEDVENWLRSASSLSSAHFVCVESVPQVLDPSRCHLLQFGCATNGLRHVERKTPSVARGGITFERLCQPKGSEETSTVIVDSAIADLGSPSCWFDEMSSSFISAAFSTTFLVRLSQSK